MSSDASLSEDLASEVFLKAVRSISSFRGESKIKTWLFSIARHRWSAYLRKKSRTLKTESLYDIDPVDDLYPGDPEPGCNRRKPGNSRSYSSEGSSAVIMKKT